MVHNGDILPMAMVSAVRLFTVLAVFTFPAWTQDETSFSTVQTTLKKNCQGCHSGKTAVGGFDLTQFPDVKSITDRSKLWNRVITRVREGEMPPKGSPELPLADRDRIVDWVGKTLHAAACADGISALPFPIRRLNRAEYTATVRDLLNIHVNAGRNLPADGAGGEGFDNAAETLFLSPIHAEKYLEAAKSSIDYGLKDPRSRAAFLPEGEDGRKALEAFIPRAFRRPALPGEVERYLGLFDAAKKRGDSFDDAISYALQAVMLSPHFLFRLESSTHDYALANRLSYFLWGSMPDAELFRLAAEGKLSDPAVLEEQALRLLKDPKSREFAENFTEQWLGTRELGRDIKPDPKLAAEFYDIEIGSSMKYEPSLFMHEIMMNNLSLLEIIDSNWTVASKKLVKYYGFSIKGLREQPKRVDLADGIHRGGLLGMAAIHALTSYPSRTSPVLRGKWVLDALLGTPPPPPPPNVPELPEHVGAAPQTVRERLTQHRANPVCASCHARIDPLGFGLENYDTLGRWRTEEAGKPIDATGELADGTKFTGPEQMKNVLMERKGLIVKNLTSKMLGYALGRGLTAEDQCAVDEIVAAVTKDRFQAHTLIKGIVRSVPFRSSVTR